VLYWQLQKLGVHCEVIAPSLVPVKSGDRIKTDRRDAEKLARAYRSGDLTAVFVPDAEHEALRDLVRAREAAKKDELRAKHRLSKFLLRYGQYAPAGCRAWTLTYWRWVRVLKFEHAAQNATLLDYIAEVEHQGHRLQRLQKSIDEAIANASPHVKAVIDALQSLRGVAKITAVTLAVEVGTFRRFERATQPASALPEQSTTRVAARARPARDRDRLERAAATQPSLRTAQRQEQASGQSDHRGRARTRQLHLGDRNRGRSSIHTGQGRITAR
jgi:transposase